jgi:non-specific serine/threonine protein kinase
MFGEALAIGREIADPEVVTQSLGFLASVAWVEGRSADGAALAKESLALAQTMRLPFATLRAMEIRGYSYLAEGDLDGAIAIALEAVTLSEELGETWDRGILYQLLAGATARRGDHDDAAAFALRAAALELDLDDRTGLAHTISVLASIEMMRGSAVRTATLLGASEAILRSIPLSLFEPFRDAHEHATAFARNALGEARYLAAYTAGLDMTRNDVVDYALEVRRPGGRPASPPASDGPLSHREMEVAGLVADGATNAQVAARLFISERTVESHLASIFNKLGVDTRLQVARWFATTEAAALT